MVQAAVNPELASRPADMPSSGDPIVLRMPEGVLTDALLISISNCNEPLHFERSPEGALEISPPPGTPSGRRSGRIFAQILQWSDEEESGESFPSGSGFSLSIGSARDADSAWVSNERLQDAGTDSEGLWDVCPDLVVEVRSKGQTIRRQQEKMEEWMAAGARLGWLIDPFTDDGIAWIYRGESDEPERLERPDSLNGEDVAKGLTVDLAKVWR